ncbi:hypothetical protein [Photobacterium sp. BZF1]|uniref:hypothetical protein n=1 Tax=Photobacterium sp. BZF1 TaxID=1904457 RepID=UPI001CA42738|nr:hypothetical protein [Photobacterium sp. BZF1]
MAIGDWRLAIGDWRLAIGDWRLAIGEPEFYKCPHKSNGCFFSSRFTNGHASLLFL